MEKINDSNSSNQQIVYEKQRKFTEDYTLLYQPSLNYMLNGQLKKVRHKASYTIRAVKIIQDETIQDSFQKQLELIQQLDHPNIIKIHKIYQEESKFYIVIELCDGGELYEKIMNEQIFNEQKAAELIKQILSAVNHCHKKNIMLRDLNPESIQLESSKPDALIKLVNFQISRKFQPQTKYDKSLGPPYFIAPEVLNHSYDEKCDIWSCGVILYILLSGYPPFNGESEGIIMQKIKDEQIVYDPEEWQQISEEGNRFIKKLLEKDPEQRYSAEEALQDEWILKYTQKQDTELPTLQKSLNNMRNFRMDQKLQQECKLFFVNYLASKDEKDELLKEFQSLDINQDGKLSKEELISGYEKIIGNKQEAENEVNKIIKAVDINESGDIDYQEWVMATLDQNNLLLEQRLENTFKMLDQDGSGIISREQIKKSFQCKGNIPEKVWNEFSKQINENQDGQISFKEFSQMIQQLIDKYLSEETQQHQPKLQQQQEEQKSNQEKEQ